MADGAPGNNVRRPGLGVVELATVELATVGLDTVGLAVVPGIARRAGLLALRARIPWITRVPRVAGLRAGGTRLGRAARTGRTSAAGVGALGCAWLTAVGGGTGVAPGIAVGALRLGRAGGAGAVLT